ncbi:MAG: hypothetical protein ACOVQM_15905 [Pirellula sp.]
MKKLFAQSLLAHANAIVIAISIFLGTQTAIAVAQTAIAAPTGNWNYIHHSSTATEGALRGQAEVISAVAKYRYMDSLAVINYQEAYRRAIENRHAQVQRYFEERAMVFAYREKYWPKPFAGEARRLAYERSMAKRLTASQFDIQTGALRWPYEFDEARYDDAKAAVDRYFARDQNHERGWGTECEVEVTRLCKTMDKLLYDRSSPLTPNQKYYASEFLRSIVRECQTPISEEAEKMDSQEVQ